MSDEDRPSLAIAIRELKERRNNYHARRASFVANGESGVYTEGAAAEVLASYDKTLAELDSAIAVLERLRSA